MSEARQLLNELRGNDAKALLERLRGQQRQPASFTTAATGGMAERLIDNVLGVPEAVARAGQGAMNVGRGLLGMPMIRRQPGETILGLPKGRDVLSGAQALPGLLSGDFGSQFQQAQEQRQQIAQDQPFATSLGEVGGDVATLATGRAPMVKGPGGLFDDLIRTSSLNAASRIGNVPGNIGTRKAVERALKSEPFQELARAGGRAVETGLEGALLSLVQDGDPVETAAASAGAQLAGSAGLSLLDETAKLPFRLVGGKPAGIVDKFWGLVVGAGLAGGLYQLVKTATPGGRDRILESDEAGFRKVLASMLLGGVAAAAGAKRTKTDGILAQFPRMADAAATIPRGAMVSLVEDMTRDEATRKTMSVLSTNPEAFSQKQMEVLSRAMEQGEGFAHRISKLYEEDETFRSILDAPDPRLAGVPTMEED